MIDHGMDAPISRILQLLKDWSIQRLTDAEHPSLAGVDNWAVTGNQFLNSLICSIYAHPLHLGVG
jgi:hypothetical protein